MQILFQALAENTAIDGKPDDRLINVKTSDEQQVGIFPLSQLIGLETLPVYGN